MLLLGDTGRSTESNSKTAVIAVFQTVINLTDVNALQNYAFENTVKQAI